MSNAKVQMLNECQNPNVKLKGSFVKKLKNRENTKNIWIPASAGMTIYKSFRSSFP